MSEAQTASLIIFIAGVLPCTVLGYLIAIKQKRTLFAGWDENRVSDPKAFAGIVGWSLILMSLALAAVTLFWAVGGASELEFITSLLVVSLIPAVCLIYAKRKYGR